MVLPALAQPDVIGHHTNTLQLVLSLQQAANSGKQPSRAGSLCAPQPLYLLAAPHPHVAPGPGPARRKEQIGAPLCSIRVGPAASCVVKARHRRGRGSHDPMRGAADCHPLQSFAGFCACSNHALSCPVGFHTIDCKRFCGTSSPYYIELSFNTQHCLEAKERLSRAQDFTLPPEKVVAHAHLQSWQQASYVRTFCTASPTASPAQPQMLQGHHV